MDRDAGIHRRPAQQSRFQRNSPDGRERHREIKREPMQVFNSFAIFLNN